MFDSFSHNCLAFGLPNYCRCPPHESAAGELWQGRRGPSHPALLCSCCGIRVNRLYRGKCWINFGILCSHGAVDLPSHQTEKQSHGNLGENVEQVICKGKRRRGGRIPFQQVRWHTGSSAETSRSPSWMSMDLKGFIYTVTLLCKARELIVLCNPRKNKLLEGVLPWRGVILERVAILVIGFSLWELTADIPTTDCVASRENQKRRGQLSSGGTRL